MASGFGEIVDTSFDIMEDTGRQDYDWLHQVGIWKRFDPRDDAEGAANDIGLFRAALRTFYERTTPGLAIALSPDATRFDEARYWFNGER